MGFYPVFYWPIVLFRFYRVFLCLNKFSGIKEPAFPRNGKHRLSSILRVWEGLTRMGQVTELFFDQCFLSPDQKRPHGRLPSTLSAQRFPQPLPDPLQCPIDAPIR